MLSILLLLIFALVGFVTRRYLARNILPVKMRTGFVVTGAVILVGTAVLVPYQINDVEGSFAERNWPHTTGKIVASQLAGGELFRPRIIYDYRVGNVNYRDSSHLHAPGFGGQGQRRDAGMRILASYPAGSSVVVHYNPDDPSQSVVMASVRWDEYAKLGFYLFLFYLAAVVVTPGPKSPLKRP